MTPIANHAARSRRSRSRRSRRLPRAPGRRRAPERAAAPAGTTPGGVAAGSTAPTTAAPIPPSVSTTVESDNSVWTLVALVIVGILLIVGAYIATVVVLKRRRRARRHDADPALAVQGAWDEALDRLQEARLRADPALTPLELARTTATRTTPATARPMRALARTYTTTRYGDRPPAARRRAPGVGVGRRARARARRAAVVPRALAPAPRPQHPPRPRRVPPRVSSRRSPGPLSSRGIARYSRAMEQRLSLVTLGVADIERARAFYEALGLVG